VRSGSVRAVGRAGRPGIVGPLRLHAGAQTAPAAPWLHGVGPSRSVWRRPAHAAPTWRVRRHRGRRLQRPQRCRGADTARGRTRSGGAAALTARACLSWKRGDPRGEGPSSGRGGGGVSANGSRLLHPRSAARRPAARTRRSAARLHCTLAARTAHSALGTPTHAPRWR